MNNKDIFKIAMQQSAIDSNCDAKDFLLMDNKIVISKLHKDARKYINETFACNLVSYGSNIVASVRSDLVDVVKSYLDKFSIEHCFETPNMHVLNDRLQEYNLRICFMVEYFLPDMDRLEELPCEYETRVLTQKDFTDLYKPEWSNALCEDRKQLDVLGIGAYDHDVLIGLAACSADCDMMWQIGVDVLPQYRCKGIASALTSKLAIEIFNHNKVPFYCAAWSNIKSVRNAIKSGFRPAWVEMTAKSMEYVAKLNQ